MRIYDEQPRMPQPLHVFLIDCPAGSGRIRACYTVEQIFISSWKKQERNSIKKIDDAICEKQRKCASRYITARGNANHTWSHKNIEINEDGDDEKKERKRERERHGENE